MISSKVIIILVFLVDMSSCKIVLNQEKPTKQLAGKFILKYFSEKTVTVIFDKQNIDDILKLRFAKILSTSTNINGDNLASENYILIEENLETLQTTVAKLKSTDNWNGHARCLVIFDKPIDKKGVETALEKLWSINIYNVVILSNYTRFYTWHPFAKASQCGGRVELKKIKTGDPFKNKIPKKVHGCHLNVTCAAQVLYYINNETGLYVNFLKTIGEKMNLKIDFVTSPLDYFTSYRINKTYDSLINEIKVRNTQAAIYINLIHLRIPNFEYSDILRSESNFLILPPRRKIILADLYLTILSLYVILLLIVLLVIFVWLWKTITNETYLQSFFEIYRLIIQMNIFKTPRGLRGRLLLIFILFCSMNNNTFYCTRLSSVLTSPHYSPKIHTFSEFLNTDLKLLTARLIEDIIAGKGSENALELMKNRIIYTNTTIEGKIRRFLKSPDFAVIIPETSFYKLKNHHKLEIMYNDKFVTVYHHLMIKRGYPLLRRINHWILAVRETGLQEKWLYDLSLSANKAVVKFDRNSEPVNLGLQQLLMPCYLLLIGLGLSAIACAIEIKYHKYVVEKQLNNFIIW